MVRLLFRRERNVPDMGGIIVKEWRPCKGAGKKPAGRCETSNTRGWRGPAGLMGLRDTYHQWLMGGGGVGWRGTGGCWWPEQPRGQRGLVRAGGAA